MNRDAVSLLKSPLEKPLSLLTEDDIAQITREECRRFLKERGMRRPSWNKSQAIQQVISLKALLEEGSDPNDLSSSVRIRRKPPSPPPLNPAYASISSPTKEASGSADSPSVIPPAKDPSPYRRKDPIPPTFTAGDVSCLLPAAEKPQLPQQSHFPLLRSVASAPVTQLTIFYGGKVNVYEDVPSEKALEIIQLAAIREDRDLYDSPTVVTAPSGRSILNRFPLAYTKPAFAEPSANAGSYPNASAGKLQQSCKARLEEGRTPREPVPGKSAEIRKGCSGGPSSRKASLKRYLEKRKDRYKGRVIIDGSSSSSTEFMYLSNIQLRQPLSRCTSLERKKLGIFVDLNDDGGGGN